MGEIVIENVAQEAMRASIGILVPTIIVLRLEGGPGAWRWNWTLSPPLDDWCRQRCRIYRFYYRPMIVVMVVSLSVLLGFVIAGLVRSS